MINNYRKKSAGCTYTIVGLHVHGGNGREAYPRHDRADHGLYPCRRDGDGIRWSKRAMLLGEARKGRDPFDQSSGLGGTAVVVVLSDGAEGGDVVIAIGNPAEMLRLLE